MALTEWSAESLNEFVVRAKLATYVGDGPVARESQTGSHDLTFSIGRWRYRDSYFGGTDFIGQEVIWFDDEPTWAMNYYDGSDGDVTHFTGHEVIEVAGETGYELHYHGGLIKP